MTAAAVHTFAHTYLSEPCSLTLQGVAATAAVAAAAGVWEQQHEQHQPLPAFILLEQCPLT